MSVLAVTAVTHRGLVRPVNQDRVVAGRWVLGAGRAEPVAAELPAGSVVAVVDGMGGAAGGHLAAGLAADVLATAGSDAVGAVHRANRVLYDTSQELPSLTGMGATVAGVAVGPHDTVVFNVGDSRVYVELDGELLQTSVDDASPGRPGAVTASLGGLASFDPIAPHVTRELSAGRRFLVASDGLTAVAGDAEIHRTMAGADDLAAVTALLALVLERGGPDNVSIVIARLMGATHD